MQPPLDPAPFAGPLAVTLAYVGLYYAFQLHQVRVKYGLAAEYAERGEKFDRYFTPDRHMLAADRLQLNTLEHMPPFLVLMWLTAAFVSPGLATAGGVVYVLARAGYPLLLGRRLGRGVRPSILLSTGFGYAVLAVYGGALVWALVGAVGG